MLGHGEGGKTIIKIWQATMNTVNEAGCANPLELLLPLATFDTVERVVYGGDHRQLPLFLVSEEAKKAWSKTLFEELKDRGWPTTMLDTQHRTHSDAAEAAYQTIYDGQVAAFHRTNVKPRDFYINLKKSLPIPFSGNGLEYKLTTYSLNYVDVANGVEEGPQNGSRYNLQEVNVVIGILKAFLGLAKIGGNIAVLTAYALQFIQIKEQIRLLHEAEPDKGWNAVKLLTANTVQAEEYDIVILSLVKTRDARGFIGEKQRANVVCTRHCEAMYFVNLLLERLWYSRGMLPSNVYARAIHRLATGSSGPHRTLVVKSGSTRYSTACVIHAVQGA